MLSGEFESVSIGDIVSDREARIRRSVTDEAVTGLSESIDRNGLIHPIVITRDRVLVAGETRLSACRNLGWTHIPVQYVDELDPRELLAIELEENVKRRDLDWKDQCAALLRFHEMHVEDDPKWTPAKTAEAIGYARTHVSEQLSVAKELRAGNVRVAAAPKYSVAKGVTSRENERRAADETASLRAVEDAPEPESPILIGDFHIFAENYSDQPFNLIHCDFPYGINQDKAPQGSGAALGTYEDSADIFLSLIETLHTHRDKLCGESCHMLFWYAAKTYTSTFMLLSSGGWTVNPVPLIWHKSDNKGIIPDPTRGPRQVYETALLCSLGDRKIISPVSNVFSGPTERIAGHTSEKSQSMLEHFFRMFVDSNTRLLDPTCGSGSAIRAAATLGAGFCLGLEKDEEFAAAARKVL